MLHLVWDLDHAFPPSNLTSSDIADMAFDDTLFIACWWVPNTWANSFQNLVNNTLGICISKILPIDTLLQSYSWLAYLCLGIESRLMQISGFLLLTFLAKIWISSARTSSDSFSFLCIAIEFCKQIYLIIATLEGDIEVLEEIWYLILPPQMSSLNSTSCHALSKVWSLMSWIADLLSSSRSWIWDSISTHQNLNTSLASAEVPPLNLIFRTLWELGLLLFTDEITQSKIGVMRCSISYILCMNNYINWCLLQAWLSGSLPLVNMSKWLLQEEQQVYVTHERICFISRCHQVLPKVIWSFQVYLGITNLTLICPNVQVAM